MRTAVVRVLVVAVFTMFSLSVSAAPIGFLDITGSARVGADFIDFRPFGPPTGLVNVEPTSTGDFVTVVDPTTEEEGTILDLDVAFQPVGVPFLLPNFMTFVADPNIVFDLRFIEPGVFDSGQCGAAPAAGQVCTPPGSPFNLVNATLGSFASFSVRGIARDAVSSIPFIGEFSSAFPGQSYQEVLAIVAAGGTVEKSYSATFTTIPEPGTLSIMLIGAGLIGLAGIRRRYSKQ